MNMHDTPRILVLRAAGINCDEETAAACDLVGGQAERVHVNRIADGSVNLLDYAGLIIPGGFSYGDHLGAGKLLAIDLLHRFHEPMQQFVADGRPVLGICNGFQVLVKTGLLPGTTPDRAQTVTLIANSGGSYECRWVHLTTEAGSTCIFTRDLAPTFTLPVGHGEGRLMADESVLDQIEARGQVVLRYASAAGVPAEQYPENPNGSARNIAGICNPTGTVFGLMPHPDRAYLPHLHPDWLRDKRRTEGDGLAIFRNMVDYARRN